MSVEEVRAALHGLQTDASAREECNAWLQEFQRKPEAWSVVHDALAGPHERALKIFCAQTLRHKITRDLYQVPLPDRLALKDTLVQLLEQNQDLLNVVGVQLCVGLAALAMQTPEWSNVLEEMITRLEKPQHIPLLFEFLKVLPEEFSTSRYTMIDPEERARRGTQLIANNAYSVLNFLYEKALLLTHDTHTTLFFETLEPWLKEVQVAQVVDSPILKWVFEGVFQPHTVDSATECLVTLIHETDEVHDINVQPVIEKLYTRLVEMHAQLAHVKMTPDIHANITRIFSQAASDWHVLILEQPSHFGVLLQAVSECVMVEDADLYVIEYTFNFFEAIDTLIDLPKYEPARIAFMPLFEQLLGAFTKYLRYPIPEDDSQHDLFDGNREEEDKFRDFRYDVGDILKTCCKVLGSERALTVSLQQLEKIYTTAPWQELEAVLFSVRTMARNVPIESEALSRVLEFIPKLPRHEKVYHGALMILGRYSDWSANHPDFLPFELEYIMAGLQGSSQMVRRVAAQAFVFVATACASKLVELAPQLVEFYTTVASGLLDSESLCDVAEGLAHILHQLDVESAAIAFAKISDSVVQLSCRILSEPHNTALQTELATAFTALGAFLYVPPVEGQLLRFVEVIASNHERFMEILTIVGPENSAVVEGLVRYYVAVVRSCQFQIVKLLPSLINVCEGLVKLKMVPSMYELAGAIVCTFNDHPHSHADQEVVELVWKLVERLSLPFLQYMETVSVNKASNEQLENAFHFFCDVLIYYSPQFVFSPHFDGCMQAVTKALSSDESRVLQSLANYMQDLARLVNDMQARRLQNAMDPTMLTRIYTVLCVNGSTLMYQMLYGYIYTFDYDYVNRANSMVDFIVRMCPNEALGWITTSLGTLPSGTVNEDEKTQTLQRISHAVYGNEKFSHGAGALLAHFGKVYYERSLMPR